MKNVDRIIEDLIKGAGRANVELHDGKGRELKLAYDSSTLLGGLPMLGPQLSGLSTAADTGSPGSGFVTGLGAGAGQLGGAALGAGLGGISGYHLAQMLGLDPEGGSGLGAGLGGLAGMIGGGMLGAGGGRAISEPEQPRKQKKQANDLGALLGGGAVPGPQDPHGQLTPEVLMVLEQLLGHGGAPPAAAMGGMPSMAPDEMAGGPSESPPPKKKPSKAGGSDDKDGSPKKDKKDDAADDEKEAALKVAYLRGASAAASTYKVANPLLGLAGGLLTAPALGAGAKALGGWAAKKGFGGLAGAAQRGANIMSGSGLGHQMAQQGVNMLGAQALGG